MQKDLLQDRLNSLIQRAMNWMQDSPEAQAEIQKRKELTEIQINRGMFAESVKSMDSLEDLINTSQQESKNKIDQILQRK